MYEETCQSLKAVAPGPEPGSLLAQFLVDASWPLFGGHFPGFPLVPGVMQIEMAHRAYERVTGRRYRIVRVTKAKFMNTIAPGESVELEASTTTQEDGIYLKSTLRKGATIVSKLSLVLAEEHDRE